jgi:SET domain-containing protein
MLDMFLPEHSGVQPEDLPEAFYHLTEESEGIRWGPKDYRLVCVGWYLNHSPEPNAYLCSDCLYAARDILEGEEILIDYNQFYSDLPDFVPVSF